MKRFLILNPRSGSDSPSTEELREAAESRGIDVHVLADGDDLGRVASDAGADIVGMAGGDGSLGAVAAVAVERDIPFVCIPFGTRNHFARDIGLDRDDPLAALAAFEGEEVRVDLGRVGDRLFLNNVSLGLYALLVHRRERNRRRRELLARVRALLLVARNYFRTGFGIASPLLTLMRSFVPSSSRRIRVRVGSPLFGSISITFET
jgi:diacylglycerol kinase family enzyme